MKNTKIKLGTIHKRRLLKIPIFWVPSLPMSPHVYSCKNIFVRRRLIWGRPPILQRFKRNLDSFFRASVFTKSFSSALCFPDMTKIWSNILEEISFWRTIDKPKLFTKVNKRCCLCSHTIYKSFIIRRKCGGLADNGIKL